MTWLWPATQAITCGYSCSSASMSSPRWIGVEVRGSRSQPGLTSWPWSSGTVQVRRSLVGHVGGQARDRMVAEEDDELVGRGRLLELACEPEELRVVDVAVRAGRRSTPPSQTVSSAIIRRPGIGTNE